MVSSSANDENNEPPVEPPDEPLPKKLCQSSLSNHFYAWQIGSGIHLLSIL